MLRIWDAAAVRGTCTLIGTSSGVANRTTEPDPAASKSATGIQSCATRRVTELANDSARDDAARPLEALTVDRDEVVAISFGDHEPAIGTFQVHGLARANILKLAVPPFASTCSTTACCFGLKPAAAANWAPVGVKSSISTFR